ncbi:hypothetical protein Emed_000745 [Eimeria media]
MGARTAALFALFCMCLAFGELLTGCLASGLPSSSEDAFGDEVPTESDLSSPADDEPDQAALEAESVDQPLSLEGRGVRVSYPRTSKPKGIAFAAGNSGKDIPVVDEGLPHQEDEEEEEEEGEISNTEELEVVRMIRLSRDEEKEKPAVWGGIGDAVNLHAPTQVILWVLLGLVVYFIMRGATRGEEKKKSLELHKEVLKTTIDSLVRGKKENQRLRKERDALMRDRSAMLRETIETEAALATLLSEIQQAATSKEGDDVGGDKKEIGKEQRKASDSPSAKTGFQVSGFTVPGFESGPAHLNKELHELLFNLGDTAFQEKAVSDLATELREKGVLSGDKNEFLNMNLVKDFGVLPLEKVKQWFVTAAESVKASSVQPERLFPPKTYGVRRRQREEMPKPRTMRDRKMDLLGLASAMVRRKMVLESELKGILEQTGRVKAVEEAALPKIVTASQQLKQVVTRWHERLKGAVNEVNMFLESKFSADTREAVRKAYAAAISTDFVLGKLTSFQSGNCQVNSEDLEKASEARFRLLQMMQHASKVLAEISKQFSESSELRQKDPTNVLRPFFSMIEQSYRDTLKHLGDLQSQLLVYDLEKKKKAVFGAPLNEDSQTLFAQLERTDNWLEQAVSIFRRMENSDELPETDQLAHLPNWNQ